MAQDKPQGQPISNLFAKVKSAALSTAASVKRKINKLRATTKKRKKVDYSKRVDIYAQGQKRKKAMEAAGDLTFKKK